MSALITIGNNGQAIAKTNYWDMPNAKKGCFYLSWNASAARLLVPEFQKAAIAEMKTAKEIIISRGIWHPHGRAALELLFEDYTNSPFSIHIVTEQCDRLIPETDQGSGFVVAIWTKEGKQFECPGKYRTVDKLPCLAAWTEQ